MPSGSTKDQLLYRFNRIPNPADFFAEIDRFILKCTKVQRPVLSSLKKER